MNEEESTADLILGLGAGYLVASFVAKDAKLVYVGEIRLHHYLVGLLAFFAENNFIKGFLLGVALDDISDLIDDISDLIDDMYPEDEDIAQITDSIREFQGKKKHHS